MALGWFDGFGCGGFFFFFYILLFVAMVDLADGWLWWWWVDMMIGSTGLRKRDTKERETEIERGRIKNDKERIFKWSVKKIEVLM